MEDKTRKITHTYTVNYVEEVSYQEDIEAENEQKVEDIFLDKLANGEFEPVETCGGQLEIDKQ